MMQRIDKAELAQRLAQQVKIAEDLTPEEGLNILLYGWKKFRKYGKLYLDALKHRDWFYICEVHDISAYAGYDLATAPR